MASTRWPPEPHDRSHPQRRATPFHAYPTFAEEPEPDAGIPHVRVCEGRGRKRPRLLGLRYRGWIGSTPGKVLDFVAPTLVTGQQRPSSGPSGREGSAAKLRATPSAPTPIPALLLRQRFAIFDMAARWSSRGTPHSNHLVELGTLAHDDGSRSCFDNSLAQGSARRRPGRKGPVAPCSGLYRSTRTARRKIRAACGGAAPARPRGASSGALLMRRSARGGAGVAVGCRGVTS